MDTLLAGCLGPGSREVLDCACGIGTQAIGLALRGHRVVGADLSPVAAARATREAASRGVRLPVAAADMRHLPFSAARFDVVVCADNSVAHLLTARDAGRAIAQIRRVLRPAGVLLISARTGYAREAHPSATSPQVAMTPAGRAITFQLWDWHPDGARYDLEHFQLLSEGDRWQVQVRRTTSWAYTREELTGLLEAAGLVDLAWHEPESSGFFQPVLVARDPGEPFRG
ncbi:MAG: class I SAM-dependent methyltransferase [Mycobacteriales bacterium]